MHNAVVPGRKTEYFVCAAHGNSQRRVLEVSRARPAGQSSFDTGLQFQTNYTLSRASDNGQSSVTFTSNNLPFNAFDQQNEDGLSNFDRRQKFVASVVYNPNPFKTDDAAAKHIFNGWTIAPILNSFSRSACYRQHFRAQSVRRVFGFASSNSELVA